MKIATNGEGNPHKVPFAKAVKMLPEGNQIHTFRGGGFMIIGADWKRSTLLGAMKKYGVELSGPSATSMGHELVLNDSSYLFIATKMKEKK